MDSELKCNRLTCRKALSDKAVVTTCSHIFCVECANELFTAARSCPACETMLSEPDDVVVCSLSPSNDYKTSVLSGLTPALILEICSRAIGFWQYQTHQENSFQQAVVKNVTERNTQFQKQLENVVREANGEISLLTNKIAELEREADSDKRKVRDLVEASKERDREYQRLKAQHDKLKRKALLAPVTAGPALEGGSTFPPQQQLYPRNDAMQASSSTRHRPFAMNNSSGSPVDLQGVVGGMEASGIQRTPMVNRRVPLHTSALAGLASRPLQAAPSFNQYQQQVSRSRSHQRHSFPVRSGNVTDTSDTNSASEVENILIPGLHDRGSKKMPRRQSSQGTWVAAVPQSAQRPFAQNKFRPAIAR